MSCFASTCSIQPVPLGNLNFRNGTSSPGLGGRVTAGSPELAPGVLGAAVKARGVLLGCHLWGVRDMGSLVGVVPEGAP